MFGDHEAISTFWPLVSYKLDGLLLRVSVLQIAVFALRDQSPCTLPLDCINEKFNPGCTARVVALWAMSFS